MSCTPPQRWCVEMGDTFRRALALTDSAGTPLNLTTGYTFAGQVRATPADTVLVATFALSIRAPATLGLVDVSLSAATTAAIPSSTYAFDLVMAESAGDQRTIVQGTLKVSTRVTR